MDPVDWQTGKTNLECSKYMLDNNVNCDVNFKVGENEETIKAHKYTLGMRSAVFDRMFNGCFCESEKYPVIPDVTPAAFKMLLRYCYYDCLDIADDMALYVLYASTKYMLPLLEEAARKKLVEIMSGSNVWDVYKYAINVGDTKLLERCHMLFQGNITPVKEAQQAEAFLNIPHRVLLQFLHINDVVDNVESLNQHPEDVPESNTDSSKTGRSKAIEDVYYKNHIGISISDIELFKACNAWAEAECLRQQIDTTGANKRTVLGDCLFLIRFSTMLQKDLMTIVFPTGILTQAEIVNLGLYIHQGPSSESQLDFPSDKRQFVVTTPDIFATFSEISTIYIEPKVRVMLSRVWTTMPGSYQVTVRDETAEGSWSMKYNTKFQGHGTKLIKNEYIILHFIDIKPQLLKSDTKYTITAERMKPSDQPNKKLVTKLYMIEYLSPFKEVEITCNPTQANHMYALTLCLV